MKFRIYASAVFAMVYLLVLGSFGAGDLLGAAVVGGLVSLAVSIPAPGSLPHQTVSKAAASTIRALFGLGLKLAQGSWLMLCVLLGRRPWNQVGVVDVPIGQRSRLGVRVSGLVLTATPGSILVDVDERRRTMRVNVIDASDVEQVLEEEQLFYEHYQKHLLP